MPFDPSAPVHRRTAPHLTPEVPPRRGRASHLAEGRQGIPSQPLLGGEHWENIRANLTNSRLLHFLTHERGRSLYLDEITAEDCDAYLIWYRQDRGGAFNTSSGSASNCARWPSGHASSGGTIVSTGGWWSG
jgi:hypothetical protein